METTKVASRTAAARILHMYVLYDKDVAVKQTTLDVNIKLV